MTKKLLKLFYFLFFLNLLFSYNVNAQNPQVDEIAKNLRCLICQGQSVYDSNSEFALSLKTLISQKLASGNSEEDIYNFLKSKYGEWIVYNPPINKTNFLLWSLPYIIFLIGGFIIFSFFRKSKKN